MSGDSVTLPSKLKMSQVLRVVLVYGHAFISQITTSHMYFVRFSVFVESKEIFHARQ